MKEPENRVKKHLLPLYRLLPQLTERNQDHSYWLKLEDELRKYLMADLADVTEDREDAYQNLLIEMYKKAERFTPVDEPTLQDSFFQKIALIRFAFSTHIMKVNRSNLAEEIRMLELKDRKYGLSASEKTHLQQIKAIKKKL